MHCITILLCIIVFVFVINTMNEKMGDYGYYVMSDGNVVRQDISDEYLNKEPEIPVDHICPDLEFSTIRTTWSNLEPDVYAATAIKKSLAKNPLEVVDCKKENMYYRKCNIKKLRTDLDCSHGRSCQRKIQNNKIDC